MSIPIDGRLMNVPDFERYATSCSAGLTDLRTVIIHHTAKPDEATWMKWGGWGYWKNALKRFYESKGWDKGPHLFVGPDGIGLFCDLTQCGRAVGGDFWERGVRHIEIVGNFNAALPIGATLVNATSAAASLLRAAGLTTNDMTHHTACVGRGVTDCPGIKLIQNWGWFRVQVGARL
jgi:hypothetical protein